MRSRRSIPALLVLVLAFQFASIAQNKSAPAKPRSTTHASSSSGGALSVPVDYYTLPNGLKVVLSPDHTAPTVVVAVYYNIGFRIEPRNRTGFAHLFEHLMFEGSKNAPKGTFDHLIEGNGGINNGSTRFDFTNYYEVVPANVLETALWLEADRMGSLDVSDEHLKNQQGVVGNEVKVNVLNQPYGGYPWIDMPMAANKNWYNSHNFYGDLSDIEAATLQDAQQFYKTFYAPNNAVLVIVGDFDSTQARQWVTRYFKSIPSTPQPPSPDLTEPRQTEEQRITKEDPLAKRPAIAIGYHIPERNTPEFYAMVLLDQLLLQGNDSMLRKELVKKRGYTSGVSGGINLLGNQFNYNGPMEWSAYSFHDVSVSPEQMLSAMDTVIEDVKAHPVSAESLELARTKLRSTMYDRFGSLNGFGLADILASFALFDNDPSRINRLESELAKVTPELVQKTAQEYLRPTNRTVVMRVPAKAGSTTAAGN